MHPLVRRLLIRGPFIFLATAGIGWLLIKLMHWMVTTENSRIEGGDAYSGPIQFGALGVIIYAILECLASAKERWKK
jgi:hypothetical protein